MKKLIPPLAIITIIAFVLVAYVLLSNNQNKVSENQTTQETNSVGENNVVDNTENTNDAESILETQSESMGDTTSAGSYIAFSESALTDDVNIIFFAATWCPSCRALDQSINSNLEDIPSNVTILKADYDKEQNLRVKYGVTLQHTLVRVDKDGNELNKWNGLYNLSTLDDVLSLI